MKQLPLLACVLFSLVSVTAQTHNEVYRKPLNEVIDLIADRFDTKVIYHERDVKDRTVDNALWRISHDAERSLTQVLAPFDLWWEKTEQGYKVRPFQPHVRSAAEGAEHLQLLNQTYHTPKLWEARRREIKKNILQKAGLHPFPKKTPLNTQIKGKRTYKDYSVENVRLEVIPGVYLCGNLYRPTKKSKKTVPAILSPHGHFTGGDISEFDFTGWGRFNPDVQTRCAELARLGCIVFSYNMFAQGEMAYQIAPSEHKNPFAFTMQTLSSIRALDFVSALKEVDVKRIGVTGASGGGTQSFVLTALDDRIALSVPVVMVSAHFFGGCACESGLPVHHLDKGLNTCNPEIAALAAPRPMLLVSNGSDWTANNANIEYPYIQTIYELYGKREQVSLVHLPNDKHDYAFTKREPMYRFIAKQFDLDIKRIQEPNGAIDESGCVVEHFDKMLFIKSHSELPPNALRSVEEMKKRLKSLQ